jgi:pilus assembly protein CpaE
MNPTRHRIFFADQDRAAVERVTSQLHGASSVVTGQAGSADAAIAGSAAHGADVLVLDQSACGNEIAPVVRRAAAALSGTCIVVTAGAGASARDLGLAVAAGARGFLLKPYSAQDLLALLREASMTGQSAQSVAAPKGDLIAVYGPKGGVGCTTVATNLAVALAQTGGPVALVDLDLQFGDVGVLLNLRGVNSVAELVGHASLSKEAIRDTFLDHPTGVRVLLAPDDLTRAEGLDPAQVSQVLDQLRGHFDHVVCDLWSMYEELTRSVLKMADRVVLVTTPEVPALRDLQRVLVAGREVRLDERSLIVVNRAEGKAGFRTAEVAKALGRPISIAIPSDGVGTTEAVNRGLSLLDPRLQSRTARYFRDLAKCVTAAEPRAAAIGAMTPVEAA